MLPPGQPVHTISPSHNKLQQSQPAFAISPTVCRHQSSLFRLVTAFCHQANQSATSSTHNTLPPDQPVTVHYHQTNTSWHWPMPLGAWQNSHQGLVSWRPTTIKFTDNGNASWHLVCRVPMVEWQLDSEDCRHLMVVGLHDTDPRVPKCESMLWPDCGKQGWIPCLLLSKGDAFPLCHWGGQKDKKAEQDCQSQLVCMVGIT